MRKNIRLKQVCEKYNLLFILLHGSQVTGKTHPKSDYDIAVFQKDRDKRLDLLSLYSDLAILLKKDKVDITNLTYANPLLAQNVSLKSKLLAGSRKEYDKFCLLTFHKYSDYLPYLKREAKIVKEKLNKYVTN